MSDRLRSWARLAWWAVRLEVSLYGALVRWVVRRPAVPPGTTPVGYGQLVAPMMGLWIFASALEVPLVHVVTPWEGLRIFLLVVSVWGLAWMVGMYAAIRTHPHLLDEEGMLVRYATTARVRLPWSAVAGLHVDERELPSTIRNLQRIGDHSACELHVAVSGRTNVTAELHGPTVLRTSSGEETVVSVSFWVDAPRAFVTQARERLGVIGPAPGRGSSRGAAGPASPPRP
jgi:hypothetical protein